MTFKEAVEHYGSVAAIQKALELKSRQAVYTWKRTGIPLGQQARIQLLTGGRLRADLKLKRAA